MKKFLSFLKLILIISILSFLILPKISYAWIDQTDSYASIAIGQQNMTSNAANQGGGATANTNSDPRGVFSDGTKLFVSDYGNHRVLIYNSVPTANNASADIVIGQANMTSNSENQGGAVAANTLKNPINVYYSGGKLFVSDYGNHRVLIYNSVPTANNASADIVIGQANMTSNSENQGGAVAANTLYNPVHTYYDGTKLFITDYNNHRVLIYNSIPSSNNASADTVVGQANMTSNAANQGGAVAANTLQRPRGVFSNGTKLFITDASNNRALIYNSIPSSNDASADIVIGQANMTSSSANQGGSTGANTLSYPIYISSDGQRLYLSDERNSRFFIFNSIPTSSNASTDIVLGQSSFTSGSVNQGGGVESNTLNYPRVGYLNLGKKILIITDSYNNRVLLYQLGPTNVSVTSTGNTLHLSAQGAKEMMVSNNPDFSGASWEAYSATKEWTFDSNNIVYVKFRDYSNFESVTVTARAGILPKTGADEHLWKDIFNNSIVLLKALYPIIFPI